MQQILSQEFGSKLKNDGINNVLTKIVKQHKSMSNPDSLLDPSTVSEVVLREDVKLAVERAVKDIKRVNLRVSAANRLLSLMRAIQRDGKSPYHLKIELNEFKVIRRFLHIK